MVFEVLSISFRNHIYAINTFTLALDFHVGPISTNGYSRPNLKVQKKQGT